MKQQQLVNDNLSHIVDLRSSEPSSSPEKICPRI